ncbi:MAG TPA: tetratricopeptide repeat protein [Casimicrobiaceae bacterium]|nr:tetratricopeptide repeat protein [Casimicrobiaceae bacterium]
MTVAAPASRNAPCPCGSGRRYKDCHGAFTPAGQSGGAVPAALAPHQAALMQDALARQKGGDLAGAMVAYERVLAESPDDFDALHMLGVVHYQRHAFDRAETLLREAIARNPGVAAARQNLALVLEARRLENAENALCRKVLARLAPLCAPPMAFAAVVAAQRPIDLLDGALVDGAGDPLFERLRQGAMGPTRVHKPIAEPIDDRPVVQPAGALDAPVTLLFGLAAPLAAFPRAHRDSVRVLVVDRDAPSALHDRLRELSDEGTIAVHLRYATQALADEIALPGALMLADGTSAS